MSFLVWFFCFSLAMLWLNLISIFTLFFVHLESVTGYLRLTLVFLWNSRPREKFDYFFRDVFTSINKILNLAGGMGTRLPFYGVETLSWDFFFFFFFFSLSLFWLYTYIQFLWVIQCINFIYLCRLLGPFHIMLYWYLS